MKPESLALAKKKPAGHVFFRINAEGSKEVAQNEEGGEKETS